MPSLPFKAYGQDEQSTSIVCSVFWGREEGGCVTPSFEKASTSPGMRKEWAPKAKETNATLDDRIMLLWRWEEVMTWKSQDG